MRARQLSSHPVCAMCEANHIITPATIADHITPHKGSWNEFRCGALQSLCAPCHSGSKAQIERKGFSTAIGLDGWPTDKVNHPAFAKR